MNRAATVVSLAVAALLAAALAALWLAPGPQARWRQWQAPPPQAPPLDDVPTASLRPNPAAVATYPAVLERPLFNPARRPQPSASAPAAAPAPAAIEQVRLQGLVAGPALTGVMLEEQGKARFVRIGEAVAGWTLERVQARAAVFVRAGQQRQIALDVASDAAAPRAATPPAGAPRLAPAQRGAPAPVAAPAPATAAFPSANAAPVHTAPPPVARPANTPAPSGAGAAARAGGSFGGSVPAPAAGSGKPVR
ncbi:MAG TPA: type II secretion system protein N [Ottowia sp.]|nr:type II secretion system protein N [Ottowia sp.]